MDVIVVGGGPVGLMTAALLDAAGIRVAVHERSAEPVHQSRGSVLHPRTLEVLTVLDHGDGRRVSDVLLAEGRQVPRTHYATLPDLVDYRDLDTPFPFVLMISQWRTEQILAELLRARGVPVHYGAEVTEVVQEAGEVRIRVGRGWHSARYVVGADGAHSVVRKAAGIDFPGTTPDQVGFVADVRLAEPIEHAVHFWNQDGHATLTPLTQTTTRVFGVKATDAGLTAGEVRRRQAEPLTLAELAESLTGICGRDFGVHSPSWMSKSSNAGRHAVTYRAGRVLLAGDAGHVHLPAGGQGLNVGLQDAANLAWKLAAEVRGWAPDRLVGGEAGYDAERRPIAEQLVASTQAQDVLMHTFSPGGAALRDLFSVFIAQGGEVARHLAGTLSGLAVAYPRPDGAHPLVGTRAPDLALTSGSLLRELRPDRFLLVDFTSGASFAEFASARVEVRTAPPPTGPRRTDWAGVQAALIRPDGYVAHAAPSPAGLAGAIAAWAEPDHHTTSAGSA